MQVLPPACPMCGNAGTFCWRDKGRYMWKLHA